MVTIVAKITIKPHHLLDIYKLHGAGINYFVPDEVYGHDFFRIGNLILEHRVERIVFTVDADMICVPCRFYKVGICADTFLHNGEETIKDDYNRNLDITILKLLEVREKAEYEYDEILRRLNRQVSEQFIAQVWNENSPPDNQIRYRNTRAGIDKLWPPDKPQHHQHRS